jgi:ribose transport system substrate-binding protein
MVISSRRRRALALAAGLTSLLAFAAGCASASESNAPTSGGGGESSTAEAPFDPALADSVQASTVAPDTIPLTTPLDAAPEKGKTIVYAQCDAASCATIGEAVEEAAKAIGWNYEELAFKSADPATLVSAMRQALTMDPVAVSFGGLPPETGWGSLIPDYRAAGVPIIGNYIGPMEFDDTVIANIAGPEAIGRAAELLADWFAVDSNGAGKAVLQRVDDYPVLKAFSESFHSRVDEVCPDCEVEDLDNTIPDVMNGNVIKSSVSALQRNPDAAYLISCDAEFLDGLPSALSSAGLTGKIQLAGNNATVNQQTQLQQGQIGGALTPQALHYVGWLTVDVAIRHLEGMEVDTTGGELPIQLFTEGGDFTPSVSYDMPSDYQDQFLQLWGLG